MGWDGRTPSREMDVPLVLLLRDQALLVLSQTTTDRTGLLVTEVEGEVCITILPQHSIQISNLSCL